MIEYRQMEQRDLEAGLALCRSAKWNQLERDWQFFLDQSPTGCMVAVQDGKVVGTATTIRYERDFSWIGMVLVDPANRRQGIGISLLKAALNILEAEGTVKLDATPAGRELYLKLGFRDEYKLKRMLCDNLGKLTEAATATKVQINDLAELAKFDREIFGSDRKVVLEWMVTGAPGFAFVVKEGEVVRGYCLGRYGFNFNHIGPVVATRSDIARSLVLAALKNCVGQAVILDVALHDQHWLQWLESLGFAEQRNFIRMFYGSNQFPGIPEMQFAILGPEFG